MTDPIAGRPERPIRAPRGTALTGKGWPQEALRMPMINDLIASGRVKAPIVIGRDHLDSGSVASPNRETASMRDGSDAIDAARRHGLDLPGVTRP